MCCLVLFNHPTKIAIPLPFYHQEAPRKVQKGRHEARTIKVLH